ncbi:11717_t:CDS:2, partial [Racocetra persica]
YLNMKEPNKYPKVVNVSFTFCAVVYILIAVCGYLMYGNQAMSEITQNIDSTRDNLELLNQLLMWLIAIPPFGKFALNLSAINLHIE